ncbi:MAG TPA: kelch repeat-containing protein, partial [Pyrinomonadaceae bacterium]|nr:kelch repeat-containing protein [Pyrinomonadaceae bacterium]
MKLILIFICLCSTVFGCHSTKTKYVWNEVTSSAAYPQSYGFPVFVVKEKIFAFHQEGTWTSADGVNWRKTDLPTIRREANETRYVQFGDAVYALGQNEGNYLDGIKFGSTIRRTTDFKKWETLAEKSELPNRVFYGSVVFGGKIWLMGGYDGKNYHNDIWNS